jgi:general secretion pathway protein M
MKAWFTQLNQREQMSVVMLGLALTLYLLYVLAWSPLDSRRHDLTLQNSAIAVSLVRVDAMVSELLHLRDSGVKVDAKRNLTSLINQSTARLQLSVSRLQPNSRGDIQVRLENAAFDDIVLWLHEMEYKQGLLVHEVSVTPAGSIGRVNATVRLAQAG